MRTTDKETISAIATPPGEAGLAIIRVSGPDALGVASRIFFHGPAKRSIAPTEFQSHRVYVGSIFDHGELIDEVVVTVFCGPRSYTCEDTVEFTCHGGLYVTSRILTATLQNGCRIAEPGEFTKRAFLNGRFDLTQAEAVAEMIHSSSELSRSAAIRQLKGSLRTKVSAIRSQMLTCLAQLEALIDFPEDDISTEASDALIVRIKSITASLAEFSINRATSRILRDGFLTPIVGLPNTGKSSLLNALLTRERAIVSSIPGTTRDTIEEVIAIQGIPFRLIDTAGIRDSTQEIEREGIDRARLALAEADIVILLFESSRAVMPEDIELLNATRAKRHVIAINKTDLPIDSFDLPQLDSPTVRISAKTGIGLPELKSALVEIARGGHDLEGAAEFLANARHADAIDRASSHLAAGIEGLKGQRSADTVASDLRRAADSLAEIIGETTTDDILDSIFSKFCIGK